MTIWIPQTTRSNAVAVAMQKRHGTRTTQMHDRREPRGGQRNQQADFRSGKY